MANIRRSIVVFIIFCSLVSSVFADIIYLKDGRLIKGEITEQTDKTVTIETKDKWYTFKLKDVEKIKYEKEEKIEPVKEIIKTEKKNDEKALAGCCIGGLAGIGAIVLLSLIFFGGSAN